MPRSLNPSSIGEAIMQSKLGIGSPSSSTESRRIRGSWS
jgi:hypothetical protein